MYKLARAVVRVLRDSGRTDEILRFGELTAGPRYRTILAQTRDDPAWQRLLAERPEITPDRVDFDALRALPADTLGGAYVRHLDDNRLSVDPRFMATRATDDPDVAYLIRRMRQSHDVWHPLLGLGVTGHEEVVIHTFTWAQLRLPVSASVMFFGTIKHMVLEARWATLRHSLAEAYRCGQQAHPLLPVFWETQWTAPIDEVRRRYRIEPCTPEHLHG